MQVHQTTSKEDLLTIVDESFTAFHSWGESLVSINSVSIAAIFGHFFFNDTAPAGIYALPLHDAFPMWGSVGEKEGKGATL